MQFTGLMSTCQVTRRPDDLALLSAFAPQPACLEPTRDVIGDTPQVPCCIDNARYCSGCVHDRTRSARLCNRLKCAIPFIDAFTLPIDHCLYFISLPQKTSGDRQRGPRHGDGVVQGKASSVVKTYTATRQVSPPLQCTAIPIDKALGHAGNTTANCIADARQTARQTVSLVHRSTYHRLAVIVTPFCTCRDCSDTHQRPTIDISQGNFNTRVDTLNTQHFASEIVGQREVHQTAPSHTRVAATIQETTRIVPVPRDEQGGLPKRKPITMAGDFPYLQLASKHRYRWGLAMD